MPFLQQILKDSVRANTGPWISNLRVKQLAAVKSVHWFNIKILVYYKFEWYIKMASRQVKI